MRADGVGAGAPSTLRETRLSAGAVPAGATGYVVTVASDGHPHVVPAGPAVADGGVVVTGIRSTTRKNLAAGSVVTVLWSPADPVGYTLIVDGSGEVSDDRLVVHPTRAVLHRQRVGADAGSEPDGTDSCVSDCIELALR